VKPGAAASRLMIPGAMLDPIAGTVPSLSWCASARLLPSLLKISTVCIRLRASQQSRLSSCTAIRPMRIAFDCAGRYEIADLRVGFERDGSAPICEACGGWVKTATISFGQAMPVEAMRRAEIETLAADLFIVAGSSLVVYPAAGFPELAKRNGAALVIVNREPTGLDPVADLVLNRSIGETLGAAVGVD
jgi:Sir2 family